MLTKLIGMVTQLLKKAITRDNIELVKIFLDAGADSCQKYNDGKNCLEYSIEFCYSDKAFHIVQLLLQAKADSNIISSSGMNAFHTAVKKGKMKIVELFIEYDANPFLKSSTGCTPLNYTNNPTLQKEIKKYQEKYKEKNPIVEKKIKEDQEKYETERNKIFRQILLQIHPDKHLDEKERYNEVTQEIIKLKEDVQEAQISEEENFLQFTQGAKKIIGTKLGTDKVTISNNIGGCSQNRSSF